MYYVKQNINPSLLANETQLFVAHLIKLEERHCKTNEIVRIT